LGYSWEREHFILCPKDNFIVLDFGRIMAMTIPGNGPAMFAEKLTARLCACHTCALPNSAKLPCMIDFDQSLNIGGRQPWHAAPQMNLTIVSYE
jgi:hypothetical protein